MKLYEDTNRRTPPIIHAGDKVYISTRNIRTRRPKKKLDDKYIGPYSVIRPIGTTAYEIRLPSTLRIHPVFHVSQLQLAKKDQFERTTPVQIVEEQEDDQEYDVKAIVNSRFRRQRLEYQVRWDNYTPSDDTWEKHYDVLAPDCIRAFHAACPLAPSLSNTTDRRPLAQQNKKLTVQDITDTSTTRGRAKTHPRR